MDSEAEFIRSEIKDVAELVREQCELESERLGHSVDPSDPIVQQRVADRILFEAGAEIRQRHQK